MSVNIFKKHQWILILFLWLALLYGGCGLFDFISPHYTWFLNRSSFESNKRKMLINRYRTTEDPYHINDTIHFRIKDAWLEIEKRSARFHDTIIQPDRYHLILHVDHKTVENYNSWNIDTGDHAFESSNPSYDLDVIQKTMDSIPKADTLYFPVVIKNNEKLTNIVIGKLILIKTQAP